MGAFVDAVEAGFVAGGERKGAGFVGEAAEGEREPMAGVAGGGLRFGFGQLAAHFTIEERGFDGTEALHAPAAGDHLVHQAISTEYPG